MNNYTIKWEGKKEAGELASTPSSTKIDFVAPLKQEQNLFIIGDNLDSMKHIILEYKNKVKFIYTDPPYNTGRTYKYSHTDKFKNSDWANMIYPRMKLAHQFLKQDGILFISISDEEVHSLKLILDEIFGTKNFMGTLIWAGKEVTNNAKFISSTHDYVLCYAKDLKYFSKTNAPWRIQKKGATELLGKYEELRIKYKHVNSYIESELKLWRNTLPSDHPVHQLKLYRSVDDRGVYARVPLTTGHPNRPKYQLFHPKTGEAQPIPPNGWSINEETMKDRIEDDRIIFDTKEGALPVEKKYLHEALGNVPVSVFNKTGRYAAQRLRILLDGYNFQFPKDEFVLQEFMQYVTKGKDLIMDIFAGSASTAHSVFLANACDGGSRKFILMQSEEKIAHVTDWCEQMKIEYIYEISLKRIQLAGEKILQGTCDSNWDRDINVNIGKVRMPDMLDISDSQHKD